MGKEGSTRKLVTWEETEAMRHCGSLKGPMPGLVWRVKQINGAN